MFSFWMSAISCPALLWMFVKQFFSTFIHKHACLHPLTHMHKNSAFRVIFSCLCPLSSFSRLHVSRMTAHALYTLVRHNLLLLESRLVTKLVKKIVCPLQIASMPHFGSWTFKIFTHSITGIFTTVLYLQSLHKHTSVMSSFAHMHTQLYYASTALFSKMYVPAQLFSQLNARRIFTCSVFKFRHNFPQLVPRLVT